MFICSRLCHITQNTTSEVARLQSDLNHVPNWYVTWHMKLNLGDANTSKFNSNAACPTYRNNSSILESVTAYCYRGVHKTNYLSQQHPVELVMPKSNHTLEYIKRNNFLIPSSLKLLFCSTYLRLN